MTEQNKSNSNFNKSVERDRELGQFKRPVKPISKNVSSNLPEKKNSDISNNNLRKPDLNKQKYSRNNNLDGTALFNFTDKDKVKPVYKDRKEATQKISLDDIKFTGDDNSSAAEQVIKQENSSERKTIDSRTKSIPGEEIKNYYQEKNNKKFATKNVEITYRDKTDEPVIKNLAKITILNNASKDIPFFNRFKRKGPNKRYRLKGFANKEYAKQVRKNKQNYIKWANRIFWILLVVILLVVYYFLDPMEKINALKHMLGID